MKIIFVKSACGIGYGYLPGATLETTEEFGTEMINLGYAEADKNKTGLPEDLPGREAFEAAGIFDLKEVKAIGDYTQIKGIGKATAEKVVEYFN